eukprot:3310104-Alexandrium_andersonii.AAC.1
MEVYGFENDLEANNLCVLSSMQGDAADMQARLRGRALMERIDMGDECTQHFIAENVRINVQLDGDLLRLCERVAYGLGICMAFACAAVWCLPLRNPDGDTHQAERGGGRV